VVIRHRVLDNREWNAMIAKWGFWAGLGVVLVAALMIGSAGNTAAMTTASPTYSLTFTESGLPAGTSWSVTFASVMHTATTSTITITGVTAGSSQYYTVSNDIGGATNVQYATADYYGYLNVPYEDKVAVVYVTQYYVTFAVAPASSGTTNPTTTWYNAYTNLTISGSAAVGYSWSKWTVSNSARLVLTSSTFESTRLQINQAGIVTADFTPNKYTASFTESGLPASTHWSVTLNGHSSGGTTATLTSPSNTVGNDAWTVNPISVGAGTQYTPFPSTASMNIPYQLSQEIVFVRQYQVTVSASPGGSGSTSPTGAAYYTAGSSFPLLATAAAGYVFHDWTVNQSKLGVGNRGLAGTNATVKNSAVAVADFVAGTQCVTCTLTFHEVGLPAKTGWGVLFAGNYYPTASSSLVISGLTTYESWSAFSPISDGRAGVEYTPVGTSSGEWYVGTTTSIQVVYQQLDYVTFQNNPSGAGGSSTILSNWYAEGSTFALSAIASTTYGFSSWGSSGTNVTLGSDTSASTTMKVTGPGVVTENFVSPTTTLHFVEYGLPSGSAWGISVNSVAYFSGSEWINITGESYGTYSGSAYTTFYGVTGTQWFATTGSFYDTAPFQTYQAIVFVKEVQVTFTTAGSGTGYVSPTGTAWYVVGTELPILAENVSGSSFSSWTQTTGTATLGSTSSLGTTATVKATGTITANFT
jgi:hypothetical protein